MVNLADFNDRSLMTAINDVPAGSMVLFEDIDCMAGSKARPEVDPTFSRTPPGAPDDKRVADKFGVTLSGLLNVLDGFHAPDAVLFMMTTNRIEALDPALLRPGRIDYRLYLGVATDQQKMELYRRFFPEADDFAASEFLAANPQAETMAEFQGLLLELAEDSVFWRVAEKPTMPALQEEEESVPVMH